MKKFILLSSLAAILAGCSPSSDNMSSAPLDTNAAGSAMRKNTNATTEPSTPAPPAK